MGVWSKSSTEDVPLRAKPAINFQDAVFYYPADHSADDDDNRRGLAHVLSEGRVPATSATACCSSDDRLPVKEAYSMQPAVGDDMPLISGSAASRRRPPSMLRRMRAFFGRSSSTSTGAHDEMTRVGRQLSAADATSGWTELDDPPPVPVTAGIEDPGAARLARSYTSPPTRYFVGGESKTEHGSSSMIKASAAAQGTENLLMAEAAAGEQPRDIKDFDEQLTHACSLTIPDSGATPN